MPRWEDQVQDEYRRPVEGAFVHVFTNDGITRVALTDDDDLPLDNPVETDAYGSYYFNVAADGIYQLEVHYGGKTEYKLTIQIGLPDGGGGEVSDEPYGPSWDGDTTTAPSKNAVYDKIETISGPSPVGDSELSQIITGLQVVWTGGLSFSMSAGTYYIDGILYSAAEQTISLDAADPTNPRIDVLAVNTSGILVKVTGQPAANPSEPDVDPVTQLKLIFVTIAAAASAPNIAPDEIIYAEGAEWAHAGQGGFVTNSTSEPDTGTYCIAGTSVSGGASSGVGLDKGSGIPRSDYITLIFRVKSKTANWGTGRLRIQLGNENGSRIGNILSIEQGKYGFVESNVTTYQQVAIPLSAFSINASAQIRYLVIAVAGGSFSCRIDNIRLQRVSTATGGTGGGITQTSADARYLQRANNLADVNDPATARTNLGVNDYRIGFFFAAVPTTSEVLLLHIATDAFTLPANFAAPGSKGAVGSNPTAIFAMDVSRQVNATGIFSTIGTISISAGGGFTFSTAGGTAKAIAVNDVIKVVAPVAVDATIANAAITLRGTKQ